MCIAYTTKNDPLGYLHFGRRRPAPWRQAPGCSAWQWLLRLDWSAAAVVLTWGDRKAHRWCPERVGQPKEVGVKVRHSPPFAVGGSTLDRGNGREGWAGTVNVHTNCSHIGKR